MITLSRCRKQFGNPWLRKHLHLLQSDTDFQLQSVSAPFDFRGSGHSSGAFPSIFTLSEWILIFEKSWNSTNSLFENGSRRMKKFPIHKSVTAARLQASASNLDFRRLSLVYAFIVIAKQYLISFWVSPFGGWTGGDASREQCEDVCRGSKTTDPDH